MRMMGYLAALSIGILVLTACAQAPEPTPTARIIVVTATFPPATATPQPTQTPQPTNTETPPAPTGECVGGSPREDWECFLGQGFEIWLPASFVGGGDPADLVQVAELFRQQGQEQMAASIEANIGLILFYALDTTVNNPNNFYSNVNVVKEQNSILSNWTIEDYVDISISQLNNMDGITLLESSEFSIPGFGAYRLVSEYDLSILLAMPGTSRAVQYLAKEGDTVWVLTYSTAIEEYDARMLDFDTSAASFVEK